MKNVPALVLLLLLPAPAFAFRYLNVWRGLASGPPEVALRLKFTLGFSGRPGPIFALVTGRMRCHPRGALCLRRRAILEGTFAQPEALGPLNEMKLIATFRDGSTCLLGGIVDTSVYHAPILTDWRYTCTTGASGTLLLAPRRSQL